MNILCKLFGHKRKGKHILAYVISSSYMNVNVKIYDVCRCDRCGEVILSPLDWYDAFCSDASWKADKEKELLRENGIVSLPEALGILEGEENEQNSTLRHKRKRS